MDHIQILAAANFAAERHAFQRRKGDPAEPYVNHLLEVAYILAEYCDGFDPVLVMGGLLHDTIEDTGVTRDEIAERFGEEVAALVEEVTDDKSLPRHLRKALQVERATSRSPRAQNLSTADKISNVRSTLSNPPSDWSPERRREYVEWSQSIVSQFTKVSPRLRAEFERTLVRFADPEAAFC